MESEAEISGEGQAEVTPSPSDASFWSHVPNWMWPIILTGILAFFLYEAIKTSENVARVFGKLGKHIRERAVAPNRTLDRVKNIEELLNQANDKMDCATAYLVTDADYHHDADIIIAEKCPKVFQHLPKRVPYTEFAERWAEGWRPC